MSQFHDTEVGQSVTGTQVIENEAVLHGNRRSSSRRTLRRARDKYIARTTVLTVAALGILSVPFISLLAKRAHLQELPFFSTAQADRSKTPSAVLAVDTVGFNIAAQHTSAAKRELLEQIAVQHLARLHQTYSSWADRNHDLMGSLLIRFTIDSAGTVGRVEPLASHVTNATFIQSVVADVRTWRFPKGAAGATEVTLPLVFVPKGMDPETVVQWERKVRSAQELESSLANLSLPEKLRVTEKVPVTRVSQNAPTTLPLASPSDERTVAGSERKVRSAQELEPSLASLPVVDKVSVTSASQNPRNTSSVATRSEHKAPKPSSVAAAKPKTEEAPVAFKTNRPVTIRENPRFSSKKLHEAGEDTHLSVLEDRGDWLKVSMAGARLVGFVRKEFVSPIN